jgi:polysaccharide biosynthesis protein PslG
MLQRRLELAVLLTLICALLGGLASTAVGSAHRAAARIPSLYGVNVGGVYAGESTAKIDAEVAAAQSLHATVIRVEMPWAQFQPRSASTFDARTVAAADRLIADAAADKIQVIAMLDRTPCWASKAPAAILSTCVVGRSIGAAYAWPPREASPFGAFAGWLTQRYGYDLAAVEIWNEPDQGNQHYLAGPNKPQQYASLLRAAYPAVKQADNQVEVLAGSLVGSNGAFLQALYAAGIKGYYDGIAVHFYTLTLGALRDFRAVQRAHDDSAPLWLDEFGWSSCWPRQKVQQEQACVTESVQAQNVASMVHELARARYVAAAALYELQNSTTEDFGVLAANGRRKPSFYALAKALSSPSAPPIPVRLRLRVRHGAVLATGSGPVGDYLRLEAFVHGALRYRAIFSLNRFNDYSLLLPGVLGTRSVTVRVYQYWLGSGQDAQRTI